MPGTIIFLILLSSLLKNDWIFPLASGSFLVRSQASFLSLLYVGFDISLVKYLLIAPTLGLIDISLSFKITVICLPKCPALFIASNAKPPVIAPSPITETTL